MYIIKIFLKLFHTTVKHLRYIFIRARYSSPEKDSGDNAGLHSRWRIRGLYLDTLLHRERERERDTGSSSGTAGVQSGVLNRQVYVRSAASWGDRVGAKCAPSHGQSVDETLATGNGPRRSGGSLGPRGGCSTEVRQV